MVLNNRRFSVKQIAMSLSISSGSVLTVLTKILKMNKPVKFLLIIEFFFSHPTRLEGLD